MKGLKKCLACGMKTTKNGLRSHKAACPGSVEARKRQEAAKKAKRTRQCPDCQRWFCKKTINLHRRRFCPYVRFTELIRGSGGIRAGPNQRAEIRELYALKVGPMPQELEELLARAELWPARWAVKWLRSLQINR